MSKWTDFQSLIQLSVALDAAYATFATFVKLPDRDLAGITKLVGIARFNETELVRLNPRSSSTLPYDINLSDRFEELLNNYRFIEYKFDIFSDKILRRVSILFSITSIALLIYASYEANSDMNLFKEAVCLTGYIPLIVGTGYVVYQLFDRREMYRRRRVLTRDLSAQTKMVTRSRKPQNPKDSEGTHSAG